MVEEHIGSNEERYGQQTPVRTPHATEGPFRVLLGADIAALPQIRFPPFTQKPGAHMYKAQTAEKSRERLVLPAVGSRAYIAEETFST